MHELSVAQEIINIVNQSVPDKSSHVKHIKLRIGKLSNILIDSLMFSFDAVTKQTNLENAKLLIEEIPVTILCRDCKNKTVINEFEFQCPGCGSQNIEVNGGTELDISEIELE